MESTNRDVSGIVPREELKAMVTKLRRELAEAGMGRGKITVRARSTGFDQHIDVLLLTTFVDPMRVQAIAKKYEQIRHYASGDVLAGLNRWVSVGHHKRAIEAMNESRR
jgi:hypothetical protein